MTNPREDSFVKHLNPVTFKDFISLIRTMLKFIWAKNGSIYRIEGREGQYTLCFLGKRRGLNRKMLCYYYDKDNNQVHYD